MVWGSFGAVGEGLGRLSYRIVIGGDSFEVSSGAGIFLAGHYEISNSERIRDEEGDQA